LPLIFKAKQADFNIEKIVQNVRISEMKNNGLQGIKDMANNWKKDYQQINIDSLELDLKNPRTDTGNKLNYDQLIDELLDENIVELAESISAKGYAAAVILMVVQEDGKNIVIDGNRRTLTVKALHNPDILKKFVPSSLEETDFKKLIELSKTKKEDVSSLTAVIYPSREIAEKEMSILHLDGEVVQRWKPLRQYRYFQKQLTSKKISPVELSESLGINLDRIKKGLITIQLYSLAKDKIDLGTELNSKVFNDKNFKTDKFQKTVVNEEGERFLGYSFSDTDNKIIISDSELFFERMKQTLLELYDLTSPYFASAQYPTQNRLDFFKKIEPEFMGSKEYKSSAKEAQSQQNNGQSELFPSLNKKSDNGAEDTAQERSKRKPTGLFFPSDVPYKLDNRSLQKVYNELRDISVVDFPNAAHDLLRSFLECSLVAFLKKIEKYEDALKVEKKNPKNLTLENMLDYVAKDKISPIVNLSVRKIAWQLISDNNKEYSVERMNMVNHNEDWFSEESDIRIAWEKMEPLFKIILNPAKNVPEKENQEDNLSKSA
jgi:hypothetical protein